MFCVNTSRGIRRQQQEIGPDRVGGPAMEGGIQLVELLVADAGDLGGDLQVDLAARSRRARRAAGSRIWLNREAVARGIRRPGASWRGASARRRASPSAASGSRSRAAGPWRDCIATRALDDELAAVVGRDREQPVAVELIVQRLQIVERGARRLDDVAPPVVPPVLLAVQSASPFPGMNCHSPEARAREYAYGSKALSTIGSSAISSGMPRASSCGGDVIEVEIRAPEGALQVIGIVREPDELLVDALRSPTSSSLKPGAHRSKRSVYCAGTTGSRAPACHGCGRGRGFAGCCGVGGGGDGGAGAARTPEPGETASIAGAATGASAVEPRQGSPALGPGATGMAGGAVGSVTTAHGLRLRRSAARPHPGGGRARARTLKGRSARSRPIRGALVSSLVCSRNCTRGRRAKFPAPGPAGARP